VKANRLSHGRSGGGVRRALVSSIAAALLLCGAAAPAFADEYDKSMAGHPLRIVAYALHPVGVAIDYLIMRPAHWLVSQEPMKTIFGHED
jgi:hypothetical protein